MNPDKIVDKGLVALLLLIVAIILGFCLWAVVFRIIPPPQLNLFTALASGVVGSAFGSVVGFIVGSSLGSRNKDAAKAAP